MGLVLKAPDKSAIVLTVVDKELNELKYERLADWFAYLERLANLGCPTADEIEKLAEIKASRDILVHNSGIANATYASKAGTRARYRDGEKLEIPEQYHRASWETINKVVRDVSAAAIGKVGHSHPRAARGKAKPNHTLQQTAAAILVSASSLSLSAAAAAELCRSATWWGRGWA